MVGKRWEQSVFADVKYLRTEVVKVAETAEAAKGLENLRSNTEVKDLEIQIK
ncbi:hypothetical protein RUM43_005085 [Polyplax serrata]|uniref:Uncharacterized protein n=1 Tax=Polyplax serrata TaxID=468196 RepID=A0AAN8SBL9_POLSC